MIRTRIRLTELVGECDKIDAELEKEEHACEKAALAANRVWASLRRTAPSPTGREKDKGKQREINN